MTEQKMQEVAQEIAYINTRLDVLSPDNAIEYQEIERLLNRLHSLEFQVKHLQSFPKKKRHLRVVS